MRLYKITDKAGKTRAGKDGETQWEENITHKAKGRGTLLCSMDVIHAYTTPTMAVFHNPIGGAYDETSMILWEAEGTIAADDGMKVGCKQVTTLRRISIPKITTEQRVIIAIKCALQVYQEDSFVIWANNWLLGIDRTELAAGSAAWSAAGSAARSAAETAAWSAARSAESAARSAESAARSAAWSAKSAARPAARSAESAARSAKSAARPAEFNVQSIIDEVTEVCK